MHEENVMRKAVLVLLVLLAFPPVSARAQNLSTTDLIEEAGDGYSVRIEVDTAARKVNQDLMMELHKRGIKPADVDEVCFVAVFIRHIVGAKVTLTRVRFIAGEGEPINVETPASDILMRCVRGKFRRL
jgi:hypothetical protein